VSLAVHSCCDAPMIQSKMDSPHVASIDVPHTGVTSPTALRSASAGPAWAAMQYAANSACNPAPGTRLMWHTLC
jgi:hypothetical protein